MLNIDPTNISDGNWEDIINHNGVTYNSVNKSLYFNGIDQYLEFTKPGDFSNGFTFELYGNLEWLFDFEDVGYKYGGLFCRGPSLVTNISSAMRFCTSEHGALAKFRGGSSSWIGEGYNMATHGSANPPSGWMTVDDYGFDANEDFYMTIVYKRYDSPTKDWEEDIDKLEYYINGELYGYTFYRRRHL